jgi:hypothetical protein
MNQARLEERMSSSDETASGPGVGWLLVTWGRLVIGLALAAEGGVLYAHARTEAGGPSWWVGGVAIVVGAVLSLSGLYSIYVRTRQQEAIVPDSIPARAEPFVPMLGALLVYKYQALTEEQLERALEQQRKEGKDRRRLGEILLDMGLVSSAELRKALEYQRSQARKSEPAASEGEVPVQ